MKEEKTNIKTEPQEPDVEARVIPPNSFINGDCMDYMKTMPDKFFDLCICDPPYGIDADIVQAKNYETGRISNGGKWKEYKKTNWDASPPPLEYFVELFRISKTQIIWGGNYYALPPCCKWLIWNKVQRGYMTDGEMAWTSMRGQVEIFDMARADAYINKCDVKIHPTQKPIELYRWQLKKFAKAGDLILDTHVGSASSLIACVELGFDYIGFEIDKDYYTMAKSRLERATRKYELFEV